MTESPMPAIDKELESKRENRKSLVRVSVTYAAAGFIFGGGAIFMAVLVWTGKRADALSLFNTILPVGAAIISYWFAGRGNKPK